MKNKLSTFETLPTTLSATVDQIQLDVKITAVKRWVPSSSL